MPLRIGTDRVDVFEHHRVGLLLRDRVHVRPAAAELISVHGRALLSRDLLLVLVVVHSDYNDKTHKPHRSVCGQIRNSPYNNV